MTADHQHLHEGCCSHDNQERDGNGADHSAHAHHHHSDHTAAPSGQVVYTCPMHPQIRQPGPGACPICGMALEPQTVTVDQGPSPELKDMTRRLWAGLAFA